MSPRSGFSVMISDVATVLSPLCGSHWKGSHFFYHTFAATLLLSRANGVSMVEMTMRNKIKAASRR